MIKHLTSSLFFVLFLLSSPWLSGSAAAAQKSCPACGWSDRGDRFEGVDDREQVSGGSFELQSVHYLRPAEAASGGQKLHLYFWLPEAGALDELRVAQPGRYYRMEPKRKQYDGGLQTFTWPRGDVIDPLGLSIDALFARLRAGDVYIPALVSTGQPSVATGYGFVFESGAGIDADCTVVGEDDTAVKTFECFEDYGGMITIEWDGLDDAGSPADDGLYRLQIEGDMLAETIRPLETSIEFRHRGRLQ